MRKNFTVFIVFVLGGLSTYGQSPWQWAKSGKGNTQDYSSACSIDGGGNVVVSGCFNSPFIQFGATTLTNSSFTGFEDIFLVKYDMAGNVLWVNSADGALQDYCSDVTTDIFGNILITGWFHSDSIIFGTTTLYNSNTITGDLFVAKYDASGNLLWAKSAGGTFTDFGTSISTDGNGNVQLTGYFESPFITFGSTILTNSGGSDVFIVNYDSSGNLLWANSAGGITEDLGIGVSADANGNVLLTGTFDGTTISFGTITLINTGYRNLFVVKYDPNGNVLWAKSAEGIITNDSRDICASTNGSVLVSGCFKNTITFGTTTLNNTNLMNEDLFIVKYDSSGNVLWANSASGNQNEYGEAISTDASGNAFLTGVFSDSISFGALTITSAGWSDVFIVKYDALGNVMQLNSAGGTTDDFIDGISADGSGNVVIAGRYASPSITFGANVLLNVGINTYDMFVARFDGTFVSVDEVNNVPGTVTIFPNPNNGQFEISSSGYFDEIKIINLVGQNIYQAKSNELNFSLHLDEAGIYFVQVTKQKETITKKIIVYK